MARPKEPAGRKVIYRNKKAFHDYYIEDRIEAGLVLVGTEVKSLREGRVSLQDAPVSPRLPAVRCAWSRARDSSNRPARC